MPGHPPSLVKLVNRIRVFRQLWRKRAVLEEMVKSENYKFLRFAAPGHFYSPIPNLNDVKANQDTLFDRSPKEIPGVDLQFDAQIKLAQQFSDYYKDIPFPENKKEGFRYYLDNDFFSYGDGVILYSMMRRFNPKRIVEVGSGFSSAAMLDVSERFYNAGIDFTFIEPFPDRLFGIIGAQDKKQHRILQKPVQQVPPTVFNDLEKDDILFVDSSHVAKIGSDVLYLLFEILPSLRKGVIIHFHDILWPFEYPSSWLADGRAWNEAYVLRAFLQYNSAFRILYFNSMMELRHGAMLRSEMPLAMKTPSFPFTPGNSSLWIQKV